MLKYYILVFAALVFLTLGFRALWNILYIKKTSKMTNLNMAGRIKTTKKEMGLKEPKKFDSWKEQLIAKFKNIPIIGLSESKREKYQSAIEAVDKRKDGRLVTPEELHFDQILWAIGLVIACALFSLALKISWFGLLAMPLVYSIPIAALKLRIKNATESIKYEFPRFYDAVYVQYKEKEVNVRLKDIAESSIPYAGDDFKKLLIRFSMDLDSGEDYALINLRNRYPDDAAITKFCSIMRLRTKGDEASFVALAEFKHQLDDNIKIWMQDDLKKRIENTNTVLYGVLSVELAVIVIIYLATLVKMT